MRSHLLFSFIALLLFCWIPSSKAEDSIPVYQHHLPLHDSFQLQSEWTRFYRLDLTNAPKGPDLLISVLPAAGSYSPKLFVSSSKEFPQKMNDADYSSISTSGNNLLISHKDLKDLSNFLYVGLVCSSAKCNTNVLIEWVKEISTVANGEKIIEDPESLYGARSALVKLTIPKEDDIERIMIYVDAAVTSKEELPSLEVFMNQGSAFPFAKNAESIQRKSPGFEGNMIIIEKGSSLFCVDCIFTLNLKFVKSSSISFQAQTVKKNINLAGETVVDGVLKGKENSYIFAGKENYPEDFVLSVKVQQGKVKVFIDCEIQKPLANGLYFWDFHVENSKYITLSHKERSRCQTENFFILVQGEESSVYSLHASYKTSNQFLIGKDALPVSSEISPQGKATYEILVPLFLAEEITINLSYKQNINFNIAGCKLFTDCPGLLPADSQHKITNYYGFDAENVGEKSEEISSGGVLVKINPREFGCSPLLIQEPRFSKGPIAVCAYLVTLSSQHSSPVEYTLAVNYKGPKLLAIGEPKFDIVMKKEPVYYALNVPQNKKEKIESIQIQLTKFSGDVEIFVSGSDKTPDKKSNTAPLFAYEDLVVIKHIGELSGVYYIGVHGLETSSFSLSAVVHTSPQKTEDAAFLLNPGKPQKGVLLPKNQYEAQFYKIVLNQGEAWKGVLRITVNSFTSRALIAVNNNGEFPTANKNMWEDNTHALEIFSNDFEFKKQGVYYVGIYVDTTDPDAKLSNDLVYFLSYEIVDDKLEEPAHLFLSPNTPFFGTLKKGQVNYFEALLPAENFPITIYKQGEEISVRVSTDSLKKYPAQDSITMKDSITLKACEAKTCPVYLAARYSGEEASASFSLSITASGSSVIALENDHPIQSRIPINNYPATFYYHAIPSKQSVVTVSCPGREFTIFAKRIRIDLFSKEKISIPMLTSQTTEFTSENHKGVAYVSVPPLANSDITIIAVSVYVHYREETKEDSKTFTILASSQITQLFTGTPYTGFVEKDHYVYFMINIMRSECTLLISLTNNDKEGDADLVISYGANTRPTTSQHQFAFLSDKKTEIIEINNADLSSNEKSSMSGNWIFGVYGYKASSFHLTVVYEDQKMIDMKPGTPVEMSLKESSFVYFNFLHQEPRNLQISLTKFSGQLNFYMTSIDLNEDLVSNLPDQARYKWQITRSNHGNLIDIPKQDHQACVSCIYLINVEAVSSCKFTLEFKELGDIFPVQDGLQYRGRLKPQEFAIFMLEKSKNHGDEAGQLSTEMKGNELEILGSHDGEISLKHFLWKETLTVADPGHIIPFKKPSSDKDAYYILLNNPKTSQVDYSFTMTEKSPKIFFGERVERMYNLDPFEKNYFVYNAFAGISVEITFYAAVQKGAENIKEMMEIDFKEGHKIKARYWAPGKPSNSMGGEVYLTAEKAPKARSNSTHVLLDQIFSNMIPKGKYMVEIENPWEFSVKFQVLIRPYPIEAIGQRSPYNDGHYDENLSPDAPKLYTKNINGPGNWHLFIYSCGPTMDLKADGGGLEMGMATIARGESYFFQEKNEEFRREEDEGHPRSVVMSMNANYSNEQQGLFLFRSNFINEKKLTNYEIKENDLELDITYKSQRKDKNKVTVEFNLIEFHDPKSPILLDITVWLCPDASEIAIESPLCNSELYYQRCQDFLIDSVRGTGKRGDAVFKGVDYGMYFVKVQVTLREQKNVIKYLEPYVVGKVNVQNPFFWNLFRGLILVEILAVVLFVGFRSYRKAKIRREKQELELQNVEAIKKGYNQLEDENEKSIDISTENSKAECRIIEIIEEEPEKEILPVLRKNDENLEEK